MFYAPKPAEDCVNMDQAKEKAWVFITFAEDYLIQRKGYEKIKNTFGEKLKGGQNGRKPLPFPESREQKRTWYYPEPMSTVPLRGKVRGHTPPANSKPESARILCIC